jgi:hypothetical protein
MARSKTLANGRDFALCVALLMPLKIQREQRERLVFALSGRIAFEDIAELQRVLDLETSRSDQAVALDLNEIVLVNRKAIRFLAACEESEQREDCHEFEPSVQSASNSAPQSKR